MQSGPTSNNLLTLNQPTLSAGGMIGTFDVLLNPLTSEFNRQDKQKGLKKERGSQYYKDNLNSTSMISYYSDVKKDLLLSKEPEKTKCGIPISEKKLYRALAKQLDKIQGLTFDHNQIRWIAYWKNEHGKQIQKHFPVGKYGFLGARKMALAFRISKTESQLLGSKRNTGHTVEEDFGIDAQMLDFIKHETMANRDALPSLSEMESLTTALPSDDAAFSPEETSSAISSSCRNDCHTSDVTYPKRISLCLQPSLENDRNKEKLNRQSPQPRKLCSGGRTMHESSAALLLEPTRRTSVFHQLNRGYLDLGTKQQERREAKKIKPNPRFHEKDIKQKSSKSFSKKILRKFPNSSLNESRQKSKTFYGEPSGEYLGYGDEGQEENHNVLAELRATTPCNHQGVTKPKIYSPKHKIIVANSNENVFKKRKALLKSSENHERSLKTKKINFVLEEAPDEIEASLKTLPKELQMDGFDKNGRWNWMQQANTVNTQNPIKNNQSLSLDRSNIFPATSLYPFPAIPEMTQLHKNMDYNKFIFQTLLTDTFQACKRKWCELCVSSVFKNLSLSAVRKYLSYYVEKISSTEDTAFFVNAFQPCLKLKKMPRNLPTPDLLNIFEYLFAKSILNTS